MFKVAEKSVFVGLRSTWRSPHYRSLIGAVFELLLVRRNDMNKNVSMQELDFEVDFGWKWIVVMRQRKE
jgi:hypothetical protein